MFICVCDFTFTKDSEFSDSQFKTAGEKMFRYRPYQSQIKYFIRTVQCLYLFHGYQSYNAEGQKGNSATPSQRILDLTNNQPQDVTGLTFKRKLAI